MIPSVFSWREAPEATFAVIGDPIAHSLSPTMHSAALKSLGRSETYVAIHVPMGEFRPALEHLKGLGYRGLNVTLPHKADALAWALKPSSEAVQIGAANTLNLVTGEAINTDAPGFLASLEGVIQLKASTKILILGAGGSARAVLQSLQGQSVFLFNRTRSRAEELVHDLNLKNVTIVDNPEEVMADLVINATAAQHSEGRSPIPFTKPINQSWAYDLSYNQGTEQTPFLEAAANAGWSTIDGRRMLVYQGVLALAWWLGPSSPSFRELALPMAKALDISLSIP